MGGRYWAMMVKRFVAGLIVVYVISVVFSWATKSDYSDDNPLAVGLIGLLIYFIVSILMSIIRALGGVVYLWLDKGRDLQELVLGDLRAMHLPPPRMYHDKTIHYLSEIAADQTESPEDRVRAATLIATVKTVMNHSGLFGSLAWERAANDAVLRYSQEAASQRERAN